MAQEAGRVSTETSFFQSPSGINIQETYTGLFFVVRGLLEGIYYTQHALEEVIRVQAKGGFL